MEYKRKIKKIKMNSKEVRRKREERINEIRKRGDTRRGISRKREKEIKENRAEKG